MIHQYQNNGYNIVLDVNSGAVHVVDQEAYDVIKVLNRMNEDHTVETLKAPETAEALKKELGEKYSETDLIDILEAVTATNCCSVVCFACAKPHNTLPNNNNPSEAAILLRTEPRTEYRQRMVPL